MYTLIATHITQAPPIMCGKGHQRNTECVGGGSLKAVKVNKAVWRHFDLETSITRQARTHSSTYCNSYNCRWMGQQYDRYAVSRADWRVWTKQTR